MMNLRYNKQDQVIELSDDMKFHNRVIIFILLMNSVSSSAGIYDGLTNKFDWGETIWIFTGIVSLVCLFYMIFKTTGRYKIYLDEITFLKEKSFFGRKRYSLKLKNGRYRSLITSKATSEHNDLKKLFSEIKIPLR